MNEQRLRIYIGLFVLVALVLLGVLITLFGSFPALFQDYNHFTVRFTDAPGVTPGTPVRRSGVRIGEVRSIELDDVTGAVRVRIAVAKRHTLRRSDRAVLVRSLLGGDASIDIVPVRPDGLPPDRTPIEPEAELEGLAPVDVRALLGQTADLVPESKEMLNAIRKSLQRLEQLAPLAEDTVREYRDLARAARQEIPNLRRTNDEVQVTVRNWGRLGERLNLLVQTNQDRVERLLERLGDTVTRVGNLFNDENLRNVAAILKNVRSGSDKLDSLTQNTEELLKDSRQAVRRINDTVTQAAPVIDNLNRATRPFAERSGSVLKNLDEGTAQANKLLADLREVFRAVTQGDGTLKHLVADPSLYNNLNDSATMLTRILPRVDRVLRDVEVFADKIARHPEALGLGGAVRPSSGLKEAPTSPSPWRPPGRGP
jgi:phospholipid/cholesterol/gamma-HCH transport system substrate-binding protein